ncbi:GNAT family N-acetyltransferase [Kordiimonas sp.]|uniref:GNAT family N-acetyltransferase n=1 Tax=Kordiimonas sp. TaxID=1970157 RepID=UPI003A8D2426
MRNLPEIRDAKPSDAKAMIAYQKRIFENALHMVTAVDEFGVGVWRQRFWIARKATSKLERCLVATHDGHIVAMLDSWTDRRRRVAHSTSFAMSVAEGWRCKGLGKKLLSHFIAWVQKHPTLERIELHVHADNTHAIELYTQLGFTLEGTRKNAVRYEDGRIVDDHIMALWPGKLDKAI